MRLINVNYYSIQEFFGEAIPRYSILSHVWADGEVTLHDIQNLEYCPGTRQKQGFRKIQFACERSIRDGLEWTWVDTCCIDKTNSVELHEAINSMFKWYHKSIRCYVYLPDIYLSQPYQLLETAFRTSKWFTRGWTLQELLAPLSVQFFTSDGFLLGDKTSLLQQIHEITGIAVPALLGDSLAGFSVEMRFHWAENRQTTREEDWAYCLLGIFGIFIPPIYGEGKENAIRRLRKEIKEVLDTDILPPLRPPDPHDATNNGREDTDGKRSNATAPVAQPSFTMSSQEPEIDKNLKELSLSQALEHISQGAPVHEGHKRAIPHASDYHYALYTTSTGNRGDETDTVSHHDSMTQLMTMSIQGPESTNYPWDTLEQPSYFSYFGQLPGTITLNRWASFSSFLPPPAISFSYSYSVVKPREVDLVQIFKQLERLERYSIKEDNQGFMCRHLYKVFLQDPNTDTVLSPKKTLDMQIRDLIAVLSRPDWVDFSRPQNQVVTRFIFDKRPTNRQRYLKFFQQLLLSMELDLRIELSQNSDLAKTELLRQVPPIVRWDLALARRWRQSVRIRNFGQTADQVRLLFKLQKMQAKMLKRFAEMMEWPNLAQTLDVLKPLQRGADVTLVDISPTACAFLSGLVLPGPTFPFLIMNSLVGIDPDRATDHLDFLTHSNPQSGFQYRNAYTYWSAGSIVGKVVAPTCCAVAGWVGPAHPTANLRPTQTAQIRAKKSQQRITPADVRSMRERSDPLGCRQTEVFSVKEYKLVTPNVGGFFDIVRFKRLGLKPCLDVPSEIVPEWYEATVWFTINGTSWPLRLTYDVSFISAWPCSDGPHSLFSGYLYRKTRADEIIKVIDWLRNNNENVLVVEAFGDTDNEVLARAWCSHRDLSAVIADIGKTWYVTSHMPVPAG